MKYLVGLMVAIYAAVLSYGGADPVFLAGVEVVLFAVTIVMLWSRRLEGSLWHPSMKWAVLLLAYVALQWLLLSSGGALVRDHFLRLISYVCVFYLSFFLARDRTLRYRLMLALVGLGLVEALYGLAQYLTGSQYIYAHKEMFYAHRARGTFINANHFAGLLEMVLPLVLGLVLYRLDRLRRVGRSTTVESGLQSEKAARLAFDFFVSLIVFLGILYSRSRVGIFSALAAVATMFVLWVSASWHRWRAVAVLLVFLVGASALGFWLGLEPVVGRYEAAPEGYIVRLAIWQDTINLIKTHPLFGTGLGTFGVSYTQQQTTAVARVVDHAHNDYLEFTAELGLLGAGFLFGLIVAVLYRAVGAFYRLESRRDRFLILGACGSIFALLFHSLADFNLQLPANALVFSTLLGLAYAASEQAANKEAK